MPDKARWLYQAKVIVCEDQSGKLTVLYKGQSLQFEVYNKSQYFSEALSRNEVESIIHKKQGNVYIPPPDHPWRKWHPSTSEKINSIASDDKHLSVRQQCELLGLNRATLYYKPVPISEEKLFAMHLIDELYTEQPSRGYRQMCLSLRDYDLYLNEKTVLAYMQEMGLRSVSPGPHTSAPNTAHKIYPYLLRRYPITRPFQVWGSDITYVKMKNRYAYLVAILDWYSRYIVSWRLSYSLSTEFCLAALYEALETGTPDIFNTDQGSQFTSDDFTGALKEANIKISMDGKGSYWDNIFTERLWRTIKYDEVYPKEYRDLEHGISSLGKFIDYYNNRRHHSSLENNAPYLIHYDMLIPKPIMTVIIES